MVLVSAFRLQKLYGHFGTFFSLLIKKNVLIDRLPVRTRRQLGTIWTTDIVQSALAHITSLSFFLPKRSVWQSECAHLVKVVVFLRFEQVEGLPLLFTGTGQQVVEHMVVPVKHTKPRVSGSDCEEPKSSSCTDLLNHSHSLWAADGVGLPLRLFH